MFGHHSRSSGSELAGPRADVEALLARLGHDVSTLDDGGDATNRQALADASERFNTASAQLTRAVSLGEISVARSVALEGIHSVRLVRTRLGLDPGSDPSISAAAPAAPTEMRSADHHDGLGGLGGVLGVGAAAGLLGVLGGSLLGEAFGGLGDEGDRDGGWGGDGGGDWGGD